MKKTISALAVTIVAVASQFGAPPVQAGHGRGLGLGLGILGGVAAAVIISDAARAEGRRRGPYCSRLLDQCDYGEDWACRRFHYRCE